MSEKMNYLMQNHYNSGDSINVKKLMTNPVFAVSVILTKCFCSDMYGSQTIIDSVYTVEIESSV